MEEARAYDRTGVWGRATIIYLKTEDVKDLDLFRRHLKVWSHLEY